MKSNYGVRRCSPINQSLRLSAACSVDKQDTSGDERAGEPKKGHRLSKGTPPANTLRRSGGPCRRGNGFTFAEKDIRTLVRRVCDILGNTELALRMSEAGPRYARQHFDIMGCTKKTEDLYDYILSLPHQHYCNGQLV